jgi:hypothetical protein
MLDEVFQVKQLLSEYKGVNQFDKIKKELQQPQKCSPQIWNFIEKCWLAKPSGRPKFEVLIQQLETCQSSTNNNNNNDNNNGKREYD